ncbi:MAG: condensation domain-containing protein, partial [Ktedonobacteraceae bacterium]
MGQESFERVIFTAQLKEERDYWLKKLSREIGYSNLQLDQKRSKIYARKKDTVRAYLSDETSQKLLNLTGKSPLLMYTALLATLQVCLYKHSRAESIVVGSPASRQADDIPPTGNVLALLNDMDETLSFKDFLLQVRETTIEAYKRQQYPFSRIISDLGLETAENQNPLFDILLALNGLHEDPPALKNDLTIVFHEDNEKIYGDLTFNVKLFEKA